MLKTTIRLSFTGSCPYSFRCVRSGRFVSGADVFLWLLRFDRFVFDWIAFVFEGTDEIQPDDCCRDDHDGGGCVLVFS